MTTANSEETSEEKALPSKQQTRLLQRLWTRTWKKSDVIAVLPLQGVIAQGGAMPAGRSGSLSATGLEEQLTSAFEMKRLKCVALLVNSPGGSPVQSSEIAARIRSLAKEHKVDVLTFCEDVAASGGYWLACAGDKIYADKATIIGSIGVISASFGFEKLIEKIGMERRVIVAGDNKSRLDPFKPLKNEDVAYIKDIQKDIHRYFIEYVKERRGEALKGSAKKLFTGDFWCGEEAVKLGLIDGIGHLHEVCKEKYGKNIIFRVVKGKRNFVRSMLSSEGSTPKWDSDAMVDSLVSKAATLSLWNRFGF